MVKRKYVPSTCARCGGEISIRSDNHRARHFCNRSCQRKWEYENQPGRKERAVANLKEIAARPEVQAKRYQHLHGPGNPFNNPAVRAKALTVARQKGIYAKNLNGGNGKGPTVPQLLLATRLGWSMELSIPTKDAGGRKAGYPYAYKVDVGDWDLKIALEIDGESHKGGPAQARDQKKSGCLEQLGWRVARFTNQEVLKELDRVVSEVVSLL